MGFADRHGRARVHPSAPEGFAQCDYCDEWRNRVDLRKQMEYAGDGSLYWLGFYVCSACEDTPQPQLVTPILPPDPLPIIEPRPTYPTLAAGQMGFQLYMLGTDGTGGGQPWYDLEADQAKAATLAALARISGVATPPGYSDESGTIATGFTAQQIVGANAQRSWIAIINPTDVPLLVSTGTASWGNGLSGQNLGPGMALFWATSQGNGACYTGALTAAGLVGATQGIYPATYPLEYGGIPGQAYWLFEYPAAMPPIPVVMP